LNPKPQQVIQSPVSNKNLSEILQSIGLGSGPNEVGQKCPNYSTYDVTHKKSETWNQTFYFSLQTRRLVKPFNTLRAGVR